MQELSLPQKRRFLAQGKRLAGKDEITGDALSCCRELHPFRLLTNPSVVFSFLLNEFNRSYPAAPSQPKSQTRRMRNAAANAR
jgi:hypothetical protein